MSFLFSQPAPGILPANSVDFSEVETISANRILGNNLGVESTIQELQVSDVATMLNLAQYAVGAASSTPTSIPVFADSNGKILSDSSGWRILGDVLMPFADGSGDIGGSAVARPGEVWVKTRINLNSLAASQILASDGSKNVISLDTATYPSLTELSYVKGVTSALQSQLNGKVNSVSGSAPISSSGGTTPTISVSDFTQATSLLAGTRGTVPAPQAGDQVKFLRGDATWATAGVDTSGASDQQVLAYDSGTGLTTWQYAGKGDGSFPSNTVILGQALPTGMTSTSSIIVGVGSGKASASGNNNTIVGSGSATALTTCSDSVLIGQNSVTSLATGADNVYIGKNVGLSSVAATGNILIGSGADTSYNQCISIGVTSKSYGSITIGNNAQAGNSGGTTSCIAIGHSANAGVSGGDQNSIAIGNNSIARGVNNVVLGTSSYSGSADGNITIGKSSGRSSSGAIGANNTVIGTGSFNSATLTSAANNTILGQGSGIALTTGANNIIIGKGNGTTLSSGSNNVLIGNGSGTATRDGIIAIGDTVAVSQQGTYGIFLGQYSGSYGNGDASIAIGFRTASSSSNSTSPWQNSIYLGNHTGYSAGTGSVGIGYRATANSYDDYVIAIGYSALEGGDWQQPNDYTVAVGYQAGYEARAQNSVLLGRFAGSRAGASGLVQQKFYLNGTTTRPATEQAEKDAALMYGEFNNTTASQTLKINATTTSTYGYLTGLGTVSAPTYSFTGDTNTGIWSSAADTLNVSTGGSERLRVDSSGNVGIGTTSPTVKLEVSGDVKVSSGDLSIATAGNGLKIKTGPNATAGIETGLSSVSTVTINTTKALTGSLIFVQPINTTDKHGFSVASISNGTSFTVDFSGNYTGDLAWFIINPA